MRADFLEGVFRQASAARTRDELLDALMALADRHACTSADLVAVLDRPGESAVFEGVHHLPTAYLTTYLGAPGTDPVMQHVKKSPLPILWSRSTYETDDKLSKWQHMADCGLVSGASLAMHLPNGRHLILSLDRNKEHAPSPRRRMALLAEMQLFAACVIEPSFEVLHPSPQAPEAPELPHLTCRELEVLKWTLAGKTAWETGRILSIAETTVIKHAGNACAKLECTSKFQAALKASMLGLI
jgi:DNA-binding CsgD family transcriptional regulator